MRRMGWLRSVVGIIAVLLLGSLLVGCGSGSGGFDSSADSAPQGGSDMEFPADEEAGPENPDGGRMIIRTKVLRADK